MNIRRIILSALLAASCVFGAVGCDNTVKSSVGNTETLNIVDGDTLAEITIEGYGTIKAKLFPDLAPKAVENFTLLAEQGYYDGLKIHRVMEDGFIQGGSLNGDGTGGKALLTGESSFDLEISEKARHYYGALSYANTYGENTTQFFIVTNNQPQDISTIDAEQIKAAAAANTELKSTAFEGTDEYSGYAYKAQYYTSLAQMVESADNAVAEKYKTDGGIPMFDGGYTVFGQVYEGFEVLEAINSCAVESNAYAEKSKPVQDIIITSVTVTKYVAPSTGEAEEESGASSLTSKDSVSDVSSDASSDVSSDVNSETSSETSADSSTAENNSTAE